MKARVRFMSFMSGIFLAVSMMLVPQARAQAKDYEILRCRRLTGPEVNGTLTEVIVRELPYKNYFYEATQCARYGAQCMGPAQYEKSGPIERQHFNGQPTLVFVGEGVQISPSCGRTQIYLDTNQGVDFVFRSEECVLNKN